MKDLEQISILRICGVLSCTGTYCGGFVISLPITVTFRWSRRAGEWFEMATVKAGTQIPAIAHGASAIYTRFLSMILSFTEIK